MISHLDHDQVSAQTVKFPSYLQNSCNKFISKFNSIKNNKSSTGHSPVKSVLNS